jgi:hypothetical protein
MSTTFTTVTRKRSEQIEPGLYLFTFQGLKNLGLQDYNNDYEPRVMIELYLDIQVGDKIVPFKHLVSESLSENPRSHLFEFVEAVNGSVPFEVTLENLIGKRGQVLISIRSKKGRDWSYVEKVLPPAPAAKTAQAAQPPAAQSTQASESFVISAPAEAPIQ